MISQSRHINTNLYKFLQIDYVTICTGNVDICTATPTVATYDCSSDQITDGTIPRELALRLLTNLTKIGFNGNSLLTGFMPTELGLLTALTSIALNGY